MSAWLAIRHSSLAESKSMRELNPHTNYRDKLFNKACIKFFVFLSL